MAYGFKDNKSKYQLVGKVIPRDQFILTNQDPISFNESVSKACVSASAVSFYLRINDDLEIGSSKSKVIGTVVEGLRPKVYAEATLRSNPVPYNAVGTCYIATDGTVTIYLPQGTYTDDLFIAGTYAI